MWRPRLKEASNMTRDLREVRTKFITPALALLPAKMSLARAQIDIQLLATTLQEAPNAEQKQIGGPAVGVFQMERGGGVVGVLTHPASKQAAIAFCKALGVPPTADGVYGALQSSNDVLDAGFARLLYWTDKDPLPEVGDVEGAWRYYLANWRPGAYTRGSEKQRKALRAKWSVNYAKALEEVRS